jgi:hypothetical protein
MAFNAEMLAVRREVWPVEMNLFATPTSQRMP